MQGNNSGGPEYGFEVAIVPQGWGSDRDSSEGEGAERSLKYVVYKIEEMERYFRELEGMKVEGH